ncbi:MAG: 2-amino-4-hydroxy-6-hydroxymethyldihydropteridine diphosphokinase [Flavisolibacter sp.]|nr:2-amino-4-hydroxy-6-hydroxymethyldihydropteridine diphosphokinase [Flavisolibacter sp.]
MNKAFLLTGGNIGDRMQYLRQAKERIHAQCGEVVASSAVYETAAWGKEDQRAFYNQALKIRTPLSAPQLLQCLLTIERSLHRLRNERYAPRTIDIDILLFNNDVIEEKGLIIPHPQLPFRRFALQCLSEIGGDELHPVLKKNISQLLMDCTDPLEVKKVDAF